MTLLDVGSDHVRPTLGVPDLLNKRAPVVFGRPCFEMRSRLPSSRGGTHDLQGEVLLNLCALGIDMHGKISLAQSGTEVNPD